MGSDAPVVLTTRSASASNPARSLQAAADEAQTELDTLLRTIGNVVEPGVPSGGEDDYTVLETVGTPRDFVRAHAYYQLSNDELAAKNKAQLEGVMKPEEVARANELADQFRAEVRPGPTVSGNVTFTGGIPVTFEAKPDGSFVVKDAPPDDGDNDPSNDPPFASTA